METHRTYKGKVRRILKCPKEAGTMKGTSEEARTINNHFDSLIAKNANIKKKLIAVDKNITVEVLNNVLSGKN